MHPSVFTDKRAKLRPRENEPETGCRAKSVQQSRDSLSLSLSLSLSRPHNLLFFVFFLETGKENQLTNKDFSFQTNPEARPPKKHINKMFRSLLS